MSDDVEALLAKAGTLHPKAAQAVARLLNAIEPLTADRRELIQEVQRLRDLLERKKKQKTTQDGNDQQHPPDAKSRNDHSSAKRRRKLKEKK